MELFNSKTKLLAALLSACSLWSCSDDRQSVMEIAAPVDDVPAEISADFARSFPDAAEVTWTVADGYALATFVTRQAPRLEGAVHSVTWYWLHDNSKKMHSAPIAFTDLPDAVTEAFYAGEYGSLTPCGAAHLLTRYLHDSVAGIYVIEARGGLDGTAYTSVRLFYTADGVLVKASSEIVYDNSFISHDDADDFSEWLPQAPADFVKTYVDTCYPGARYLYIRQTSDVTKVKILHGHVVRLLLFDAAGAWTSTATEIDRDDIPAEILASFRASAYAGWHIAKITEYATASDGHYYLLSLEKSKDKAELRIEADGTIAGTPALPSDPSVDNDNTILSASDIEGFVLARYPGASIVKSDYDDDDAEVKIIYENHDIKVCFRLQAQGYRWSGSEWSFDITDTASIPAPVLKTLADNYSGYRLTYLVYNESATSASSYEAGLKSSASKNTIKVLMDEQGNIIAHYGKH